MASAVRPWRKEKCGALSDTMGIMRTWLCFGTLACMACGGTTDNPLFADVGPSHGDEHHVQSDAYPGLDDAGMDATIDMGPGGCDNLECQIVQCESGSTTLSGTVTTPNGQYPIYNAVVYIPNAPTSPIADGVQCEACQAPLTGKPLVKGQLGITTTDSKGRFLLKDVPVGPNIPIVIQIGKWRRESKVQVTQCTDNEAPKDATRLPKNQQEGHLPLIAVQGGVCDDPACTLLTRIGIDQAEFTPSNGGGRVHTYTGYSVPALPQGSTSAYALWGNLAAMQKYDLLIGGCECQPIARDAQGPAYDNLKKYLESGGRFIGTHYHYNWFASQQQMGDPTCKGPVDFNGVAKWGYTQAQPPVSVDQGHPRGAAFASWLVDQGASSMLGMVALNGQELRNDVGAVNPPTTRWMSESNGAESLYLTFNTPVGGMKQCGRAAFSDMHIRGDQNLTQWPTSCQNPPLAGPNQEIAFTFLFFDMFGCVQDDTKMPIVPPVP